MQHIPLKNYLRTARRRLALSQHDLRQLLGTTSRTMVSYHERDVHLPSLKRALGYAVILGFPIDALFAGLYQEVEKEIAERASLLASRLQEDTTRGLTKRKLETLRRLAEEHLTNEVCQE